MSCLPKDAWARHLSGSVWALWKPNKRPPPALLMWSSYPPLIFSWPVYCPLSTSYFLTILKTATACCHRSGNATATVFSPSTPTPSSTPLHYSSERHNRDRERQHIHPHPSLCSGQALSPLPSRERGWRGFLPNWGRGKSPLIPLS